MPRSYASLLRHSELGCLFRWRADALSIRRAFYLGARLIAGCLGLNHEAILHDLWDPVCPPWVELWLSFSTRHKRADRQLNTVADPVETVTIASDSWLLHAGSEIDQKLIGTLEAD